MLPLMIPGFKDPFDIFDALGLRPSPFYTERDIVLASNNALLIVHPDKRHLNEPYIPAFPTPVQINCAKEWLLADLSNNLRSAYIALRHSYRSTWNPRAKFGTPAVLQPLPDAEQCCSPHDAGARLRHPFEDDLEGITSGLENFSRKMNSQLERVNSDLEEISFDLKWMIQKRNSDSERMRSQLDRLLKSGRFPFTSSTPGTQAPPPSPAGKENRRPDLSSSSTISTVPPQHYTNPR